MNEVKYHTHFSMVNQGHKLDVFVMTINQKLQVMLYITDGISGEVNVFTLKDDNLVDFVQRLGVLNIY